MAQNRPFFPHSYPPPPPPTPYAFPRRSHSIVLKNPRWSTGLLLHRLTIRISLPFHIFLQVVIGLIQVYNWQIRYHSLICRCGLADSLYITIQQVRAVKLHVSTYFTSVSFISWRSLVMDKSSSATCLLHSDVVKGDPSQVPCTWLRKRTKKKPWKGQSRSRRFSFHKYFTKFNYTHLCW